MKGHSYRFEEGDLLEVAPVPEHISAHPDQHWRYGPLLAGLVRRIGREELKEGEQYLALSDAKHSSHRDNKRLYVEIMTPSGPALCWCDAFRMKPPDEAAH